MANIDDILSKPVFEVLLIEDQELPYRLTERALTEAFGTALQLTWVRTVNDAVTHLRKNVYDACLMDYVLKDGDASLILSQLSVEFIETPIIILSSFDDEKFILEAMRSGADNYLVKGKVDKDDLTRSIRYAICSKERERALWARAFYDPLTGLANRATLMDRLNEYMSYASRNMQKFAILFIDLDGFKQVNDTYGHDVGDSVLRHVTQALLTRVRSSDTVARMGGDEFVLLIKNVVTNDAVQVLAYELNAAVDTALQPLKLVPAPSCSIGISFYPETSTEIDGLLKSADEAMYAAKAKGGRQACVA